MSYERTEQANKKLPTTMSSTSRVLRRKCACGQVTTSEECHSCSKEASAVSLKKTQYKTNKRGSESHTVIPFPLRSGLEALSGVDLSGVRVHHNSFKPAQLHALAYTQGQDIYMGPGQSKHLPHEGWHVVQQMQGRVQFATQAKGGLAVNDDPALEREADLMGAKALRMNHAEMKQPQMFSPQSSLQVVQLQDNDLDAGVPLPGGVVDVYVPRVPVDELTDIELGEAYEDAKQLALSGDSTRINEIEAEVEERVGFGTWATQGTSPRVPANTFVTSEVALRLLNNMADGQSPFRPELGKGQASWFVTEGSPYVGIDASKIVEVKVEVAMPKDRVVFHEPELLEMLEKETKGTAPESEATFRKRFGLEEKGSLSNRLRKSLARFQKGFAESRMWDRVGQKVKSSASGIGEVILKEGSRFSKTPGKFAVVADSSKVQLKGGTKGLVDTLSKQGTGAKPAVVGAAEALASKMKWAGRVRGVFHYGGRVLIVLAVTADVYKIYRAENKQKAIITSAGGWAGAVGMGTAFAAWFAPADAAGPWAWAAHGVGTLVAGGVGYWVGSETTRYVYELVAE